MSPFRLSIGIFLLVVAGLIAATGTRGGRGFFAPDTLAFEAQSEYTVLDGLVPIYRSARQRVTYPLLDYLLKSGHVPILSGPPRKWDEEYHWNFAWKDGYSSFHRALSRESAELIAWSEADPERARLFWSTLLHWKRSPVEKVNWAANDLLQSFRRCHTMDAIEKVIAEIETDCNIPHSATRETRGDTIIPPEPSTGAPPSLPR